MKMIYVSGDEYASLLFEQDQQFNEVSEFISTYFDEGENEIEYSFICQNGLTETVSVELFEFDSIDPQFIVFIRKNIQDYDDSKHHNFYFEGDKF